MAIKLASGVATLPASVKDGKVFLDILDHHWEIEVPIKQEYPMQLKDYDNPAVFGLFTNEKTMLIIRRDGTASVIHKSDKALYKNFVVEIPEELLSTEVQAGGMARYVSHTKGTLLTTGVIKSLCVGIITLDAANYSVVFDTRKNYEYITDLCLQQGVSYPTMFWQDYTLIRREDINDPKSKMCYKIEGDLITHQAVGNVK